MTIELREFHFKQHNSLLSNIPIELKIEIGSAARKQSNNNFILRLESNIIAMQNDQQLYTISSDIISFISVVESFDKKLLNNIAAILYSYLRPLAAQMTVMAKLPALDIPPLDLSKYKVEISEE